MNVVSSEEREISDITMTLPEESVGTACGAVGATDRVSCMGQRHGQHTERHSVRIHDRQESESHPIVPTVSRTKLTTT